MINREPQIEINPPVHRSRAQRLKGVPGELKTLTADFVCSLADRTVSKLIHYPAERRMAPVLHLDPVIKPATGIDTVPVLRHQAFQPHQARVP